MFLLGVWVGFWTATAWWTWMLSFYEPKPLPPTANVVYKDGQSSTTEYRPHWERSGP